MATLKNAGKAADNWGRSHPGDSGLWIADFGGRSNCYDETDESDKKSDALMVCRDGPSISPDDRSIYPDDWIICPDEWSISPDQTDVSPD